jgi:hypothetical protein
LASTSLYNAYIITCDWVIEDLGANFNSLNYRRAGVATQPVESDQSYAPAGIKGTVSAPSSGSSRDVSGTATGLTDGSNNILYGFAQAANGNYYPCGSDSIYTRGYNWDWYSPKVSGQPVYLSAIEWNAFCTRINQFRRWIGLGNDSFPIVNPGDSITAVRINRAIDSINSIYDYFYGDDPVINTVVTGGTMYASLLNDLRNYLNAIE